MSNAPRPATWNSRSRSCAGQDRAFGQRMSASPSFSGAERGAALRAVRRHHERPLGAVAQLDDRPDDLGDHVAGLAQHHGVADQHALAGHLLRRCAGWPCSTVEPETCTGSITPERRDPPGAADVDPDVEQLGGDLLRRVLVRDRPPRRARRRAEPALGRDVVDLDHDAVDLVVDVVPVLAVVGDELRHRGQVVEHLRTAGWSAGPTRSAPRTPATASPARTRAARRARARPAAAAGTR